MKPARRSIRSWKDAEENAVAWMRHWGFTDAQLTGAGSDAGLDVVADGAVAQVKYQAAYVGRPELQRLVGANGRDTRRLMLFFAGSDFATTAQSYADEMGIALFTYGLDGQMLPVNHVAHRVSVAISEQGPKRRPGLLNWRLWVAVVVAVATVDLALSESSGVRSAAYVAFGSLLVWGLVLDWRKWRRELRAGSDRH